MVIVIQEREEGVDKGSGKYSVQAFMHNVKVGLSTGRRHRLRYPLVLEPSTGLNFFEVGYRVMAEGGAV